MTRRAWLSLSALLAALLHLPAAGSASTPVTGTASVLWIDQPPGSEGPTVAYTITTPEGPEPLEVSGPLVRQAGGPHALRGARVVASRTGSGLTAISVRPVQPAAVTGLQRRAVLLCEFSDSPTPVKRTQAFYQGMFDAANGLEAFFAEVSYGQMPVEATVFDWQTIGSRATYGIPASGVASADYDGILTDCGNAHTAAVNFSLYEGVDVILDENDGFGAAGVGGTSFTTLDGLTRLWPATWIPSGPGLTMALWGHEMGHSFGLPHSSGLRRAYTQFWDPMDGAGIWCFLNSPGDPNYGCMPQHYLSAFKDEWLGWIAGARRYVAPPGMQQQVTLERLAQPRANTNVLTAKIRIPRASPAYYTAELRSHVGSFDSSVNFPGDGVIITEVIPGCSGPPFCPGDYAPAQVVGKDANEDFLADPNASMWIAGETFRGRGGVIIRVGAFSPQQATVTIGVPGACRGRAATKTGTLGADTLKGGKKVDAIDGVAGGDNLAGNGNQDFLCGSEGDDTLAGGPGGDTLDGGPGRDVCIGGPGKDTAVRCEVKRSI